MKNNVKALAALFLASFAFLVTACKTEVADTMPPAKVTDVNATAANGKAVITWTNPADEDFYATRITVAPKVENGNSSLVIEGSPTKNQVQVLTVLQMARNTHSVCMQLIKV